MFGLFKKDPAKQLQKEYESLLKKAMEVQRGGDIKGYATISAEAEAVLQKIEALRS